MLCYITCVMLCYITKYVMLCGPRTRLVRGMKYHPGENMLCQGHNEVYMLCYITYVILYNIKCVMLCYIT